MFNKNRLIQTVITLLALVATLVTAVPNADAQQATPTPHHNPEFVTSINTLRVAHGVAPLIPLDSMNQGADAWTPVMIQRDELSHAPNHALADGVPQGYSRVGENVGRGGNVDSLMTSFMNSPAHRDNILNPEYTHIGVSTWMGKATLKATDGGEWVGEVIYTTHRFAALPTAAPTPEPTAEPTVIPTAEPTAEPTAIPTAEPTAIPTAEPTAIPTAEPTAEPTAIPTAEPTAIPTAEPTAVPAAPTAEPTAVPAAPVVQAAATAEPLDYEPAPTSTPVVEESAPVSTVEESTTTTETQTVAATTETQTAAAAPTAEPTAEPAAAATTEPTAEPTPVSEYTTSFVPGRIAEDGDLGDAPELLAYSNPEVDAQYRAKLQQKSPKVIRGLRTGN